MSKYLIHTMPKRMWYVCGYLIPSMVSQGIDRDDIKIFNDVHHLGCLHACMRVFSELPDEGQTWHLQDDVIISKDFKQVTETSFETIACGFASDLYDKERLVGRTGGMPSLNFLNGVKNVDGDISKIKVNTSVDFASLSGSFIAGMGDFVNLFELKV